MIPKRPSRSRLKFFWKQRRRLRTKLLRTPFMAKDAREAIYERIFAYTTALRHKVDIVAMTLFLLFSVPVFASEARPIKPFREIKKEIRKMDGPTAYQIVGAAGWLGAAVFMATVFGPIIVLQLSLGIAALFLWPIIKWLFRRIRRMMG